ncbi:hypothetical protein Pyn_39340 [Prunus yedoensis var. nudiflora]|uniref:glyoxylate reductase (NADP(+)) n=1 Tax=Prunus yedoensis var. nudiflora TaxID=2094558 RepID=A0A314ZB55_PRUYE|nr:hypothetical protein Pyn_39340 [Prunus yedoensis var. nudiflora]
MMAQDLPQLLIIHPPLSSTHIESQLSQKFHLLRAWESELPLDKFLTTYARSVQAMLCSPITRVNADLLRLLPALKLVATPAAGVNNIDLVECRQRGISVTTSGSAFSEDVADIAIGLLIDVQRKISAARSLGGKRVGIVGLGNIGSEVAKRLEAFGCVVSYNSRRKKQASPYLFYSNVHELAANTDALIICCAFTDQTRHMINKEVLSALGREGVIVNVGRGAIIDEKELVRCLVHGEIGGAGLDVFENEPHVPQELFALDNVVLSPHKAALTPESFERSNRMVIANLEAFFSNKPLVTPFNG